VDIVIFILIMLDTAYAKNPIDLKWYDCDDSRISLHTGEIITPATYLLFYQKRNAAKIELELILARFKVEQELEIQRLEQQRILEDDQRRKMYYASSQAHLSKPLTVSGDSISYPSTNTAYASVASLTTIDRSYTPQTVYNSNYGSANNMLAPEKVASRLDFTIISPDDEEIALSPSQIGIDLNFSYKQARNASDVSSSPENDVQNVELKPTDSLRNINAGL
jgi:hypothetical protein